MRVRLLGIIAAVVAVSCTTVLDIDEDGPPVTVGAEGGVPGDDGGLIEGGPAIDGGGGDAQPCTAQIEVDPANCGACGHDCGGSGSGCTAGLCMPVLVAPPGASMQFGANARIATLRDAGAFTDDQGNIGPAAAGNVYRFDPTAVAPVLPAQIATQQANPSLVALGVGHVFWTQLNSTVIEDDVTSSTVDVPDGGVFSAIVTSSSGAELAALATAPGSSTLTIHTTALAPLGPERNIVGLGEGRGIAFEIGDRAVFVAIGKSVVRCIGSAGACSTHLSSSHEVLDVALSLTTLFFATDDGAVQSSPLASPTSQVPVLSGLVGPIALKTDEAGAVYALDAAGIRTTKYGSSLLLASSTAKKIFAFALSPPWVYFLRSDGLYRVRR